MNSLNLSWNLNAPIPIYIFKIIFIKEKNCVCPIYIQPSSRSFEIEEKGSKNNHI